MQPVLYTYPRLQGFLCIGDSQIINYRTYFSALPDLFNNNPNELYWKEAVEVECRIPWTGYVTALGLNFAKSVHTVGVLMYFYQRKFPLGQAYSCVLELGNTFNALSRTTNRQNTTYSSQNNHNTIGLTIQIKVIQFSAERTVATGNNKSQGKITENCWYWATKSRVCIGTAVFWLKRRGEAE